MPFGEEYPPYYSKGGTMKARVTITCEQELVDRINAEAARQRRSTSNLIEVIILDYLDRLRSYVAEREA